MLIRRYEKCVGLSFPAIGKYKIEFWFCPRNYEIREHTHPSQNIKLVLLFGHNILFHRRKKSNLLDESYLARFKDMGKVFTINAGDAHWFSVSGWPLVFLNIEKYLTGKPTSAAEDLVLT
jgi:hypothetical protein